jgi:Sortilin, neurotensin receptor 3, C-terminal
LGVTTGMFGTVGVFLAVSKYILDVFRCDYGYVRDSGRSSGCVRDPNHDMEPEGGVPAICPPGTKYNLTKGYVRLAGDVCEGGQSSRYEPEVRACPTDIRYTEQDLLSQITTDGTEAASTCQSRSC